MPTGTTGHNLDVVDVIEKFRVIDTEVDRLGYFRIEIDFEVGAHHRRLLIDFLKHVVPEALFFDLAWVPVEGAGGFFEAIARKIINFHPQGRHPGHFTVFEGQHRPRVGD